MIIRAAFTFILAFLSSATSAEACSCIIPPTLSERLADGDAVVRGHVVELEEFSRTVRLGTHDFTIPVFRYRVIVTQSVNYSVGCELIVEAIQGTNCSGHLPMDRSFVLVFQQGKDELLSYGMCRSYREAPADWDVFFRDHEAAAYIEGSSNPERPLCHGLMNLMN
jgi:hypothetical protein